MFAAGRRFKRIVKRKRSRAFGTLGGKDTDELLESDRKITWEIDKPIELLTAEAGPLAQKPVTIMTALQLTVEKYPTRVALATKVDGVWEKWTFQDVYALILKVSKGFIRLGLERHHGVAIFAYNSPEWVISHFAAIFAGGISSPLYCESSKDDLRLVVTNAKCNIIVINTDKQLENLLSIRNRLPYLKAIVQFTRGNFKRLHHMVVSWAEVLEMGTRFEEEVLTERIQQQAPNLCCSVIHTPGTTGNPKPVMISHDNVIWTSRIMGRCMQVHYGGGVIVSYMPLSSLSVQLIDIYIPSIFATTVYFTTNGALGEELRQIMKEVQPTIFSANCAMFERMREMLEDRFARRNATSRAVIRCAMRKGMAESIAAGHSRPLLWGLANAFVFKELLRDLGMNRTEIVISIGQSLLRSTLNFFASLNCNIQEIYGLTEVTGLHTKTLPGKFRFSSVGQEMDGCGTNIVHPDDTGCGKIQVRGRHVCMGYLNMERQTKEAFDEGNWFRTEDFGRKDKDGFLYITGRDQDIVTLKTNVKVQSVTYEMAVKDRIPCVDYCILVGNDKKYLAMLLTLKTEVDPVTQLPLDRLHPQTRQWIASTGYQVETLSDIISQDDKRLRAAIQMGIDDVNANFPIKIERWKLLPKTFSFDGGELTYFRKMKRFVILKNYASDIRLMYARRSL